MNKYLLSICTLLIALSCSKYEPQGENYVDVGLNPEKINLKFLTNFEGDTLSILEETSLNFLFSSDYDIARVEYSFNDLRQTNYYNYDTIFSVTINPNQFTHTINNLHIKVYVDPHTTSLAERAGIEWYFSFIIPFQCKTENTNSYIALLKAEQLTDSINVSWNSYLYSDFESYTIKCLEYNNGTYISKTKKIFNANKSHISFPINDTSENITYSLVIDRMDKAVIFDYYILEDK